MRYTLDRSPIAEITQRDRQSFTETYTGMGKNMQTPHRTTRKERAKIIQSIPHPLSKIMGMGMYGWQ